MVFSLLGGVLGSCGSPNEVSQVHVSKWEPPAFHFYKVNVDEAVFKEQKEAGVGVVI